MIDTNDRMLTTAQVARRENVAIRTVQRWVKEGWVRAHKTPGGRIRIRESDLAQASQLAAHYDEGDEGT